MMDELFSERTTYGIFHRIDSFVEPYRHVFLYNIKINNGSILHYESEKIRKKTADLSHVYFRMQTIPKVQILDFFPSNAWNTRHRKGRP